jgi:uncharacterized glyoxalase superfamily protein PhnB
MTDQSGHAAGVQNRSVPTNTVLPHLVYEDVAEAVNWLATTFGFTEHYRYGPPDGPVQGAQVRLGDAWIMLEKARAGRESPAHGGQRSAYLTLFVLDVDAHYAHTQAAGARIVEEINETVYGERQYGVVDLGGHYWIFSQHARDVSPAEWGATIG